MKAHLRLIQFIGLIVPRRLHTDWRQEWEAELRSREALLADWDKLNWQTKLDLLWRSTSAFWDALCFVPVPQNYPRLPKKSPKRRPAPTTDMT